MAARFQRPTDPAMRPVKPPMRMQKGRFLPALVTGFLLWPLTVGAQENVAADKAPEALPASLLTGNVTLASQYVSRGIRQTWGEPAVQLGLDYANSNGWSAGTWMSNVSKHYIEGGVLEWDLYGGYSGHVGDVGYSTLLYYYKYPSAKISATGTRFDYAEASIGLTYKFLYVKYNRTVTRDYFGITNARGSGYLDAGATIDLGSGYTLNLHAGDGHVTGAGNDIWDWRDAKIGVTQTLGKHWSVALAYTRAWADTDVYQHFTDGIPNRNGALQYQDISQGTVVLSVTKSF